MINSVWYDQMQVHVVRFNVRNAELPEGTVIPPLTPPNPSPPPLKGEGYSKKHYIFLSKLINLVLCLPTHWSFSLSTQNGRTGRSHIFPNKTYRITSIFRKEGTPVCVTLKSDIPRQALSHNNANEHAQVSTVLSPAPNNVFTSQRCLRNLL